MGLTNQERINVNSKVLSGGVYDGLPTKQYYEALRPNAFILEDGQVLTQFATVRGFPAANLSTARNNVANNLGGIVEDKSQFADAVRLTPDIASNGYQYVALATYNDFSSGRLDKWIQPQKVPQTNGQPSIGYSIQLYDGDPNSGGTLVNTSDGQTGSGDTASVGWIWNYDLGILILSTDFKDTVSDPYVVGFRYIGETVADLETGGGGSSDTERYFFETTQTSHGYSIGSQLIPVYKTSVSGWVPSQANSAETLTVGFITNAPDVDTLEITLGGRVTVSGHSLLTEEYYFLSVTGAGQLTADTPVSGVVQPVLWVEDDDVVVVKIERANELTEEPDEVLDRIQTLEINVSGIDNEIDNLESRTDTLEDTIVPGGATAAGQVLFWTAFETFSGVNEFKWNDSTQELDISGDLNITGTVDGRDIAIDASTFESHIADTSIHYEISGIDHGSIVGLNDDDHIQYLLADGSRNITGPIFFDDNATISGQLIISDFLIIKETNSSPTDIADQGQVFVKYSDSKLYYRDDSGTEFDLTANSQFSGDIDGGTFLDTYENTADVDGGTF